MRAPLLDGTVFQNNNFIRIADCADTVCDNQLGGIGKLQQSLFGFHIQCACGIVQHQNGIFLGDGARNADTLLLPAGKPYAAFTDNRIILFIQFFNKITGLGTGGSAAYRR